MSSSNDVVLHGYDPSSYVFSVRILLAEKGVACERVPLDVVAGEARTASHRKLHPFGKVPVFGHGGLRILETAAIMRYINDAFDGPSFIPTQPAERARMDMATGLYDSYGYRAMARVVGYHRFPVFAGNPTRATVDEQVDPFHTLFGELMRIRGESPFLAGDGPSLADFFVAPACFCLDLVEESGMLRRHAGFEQWWDGVRQLDGYRAAVPDLGDWGERGGDSSWAARGSDGARPIARPGLARKPSSGALRAPAPGIVTRGAPGRCRTREGAGGGRARSIGQVRG